MKQPSVFKSIFLLIVICLVSVAVYTREENHNKSVSERVEETLVPGEIATVNSDEYLQDGGENNQVRYDISEIFAMENMNDMIADLDHYIAVKCDYGENMSALSEPERVFYVTQTLEMEVCNGGFHQYFFNSSGNLNNELLDAYTTINAMNTVEICKKALDAFGCEVPTDRIQRHMLMDQVECDEFMDLLDECDNEFYEYKDDLLKLNYEYVMKNREAFN